jgi:hypothetical protein
LENVELNSSSNGIANKELRSVKEEKVIKSGRVEKDFNKSDANNQKYQSKMLEIENEEVSEADLESPSEVYASLGYTLDDIALLKPRIKQIILDRSVYKPKIGIPEEWKISSSISKKESMKIAEASEKIQNVNYYQDDIDPPKYDRNKKAKKNSKVSRNDPTGSFSKKDLDDTNAYVGEKFSWRGKPPTAVEIDRNLQVIS